MASSAQRVAAAFGAVLLMVAVLLVASAPDAQPRIVGYSHSKGERFYPRGQWVSVGSVPVTAGGTVTVHSQTPVQWRGTRPALLRIKYVRMPRRDGTADLDVAVAPGVRRWHLTHSHTVRGFTGRMQVRLFVPGTGRWSSPYRIIKATR